MLKKRDGTWLLGPGGWKKPGLTWVIAFLFLFFSQVQDAPWLSAAGQVFQLEFKKQIPLEQKDDVFTYTIKKGDYVYAILRRFQVPETRLDEVLEQVRELNPHFQDLGLVKPGQPLYLPDRLQKKSARPLPKFRDIRDAPLTLQNSTMYTVQPGDTVFTILQQKTDLSARLIMSRYLEVFRGLNPELEDIDLIRPGQKLRIPVPGSPEASSRTELRTRAQKSPRRATEGEVSAEPEKAIHKATDLEKQPLSEQRIVRSLLEEFGFRFVSGEELLLPSGRDKWVRINLERMAMARTPWQDKVLFLPGAFQNQEDQAAFRAAGLKICRVPQSWDQHQVFQNLEKELQPRFIFWPPGKALILPFQRNVLELRSNSLVALRAQDRFSFYLFEKSPEKNNLPSGLLTGFLASKDIQLLIPEVGPELDLQWQVPDSPQAESLYVPTLPRRDFLPALTSLIPVEGLVPEGLGSDFRDIFAGLKARDMAGRERLQVKLFASRASEIRVRCPVFRLALPSGDIYLLEGPSNDPYLLALLNLQGFTTFQLAD